MIEEYCLFCKDYASERNESLLSNCRVQLILLQRYAFLLKDARNYWKMFESEEDKKVYPRLPDVWGKKNTPYYILFQSKHDGNFYGAGNHLAFPIRNKARHQLNYSQSLFVERREHHRKRTRDFQAGELHL